jgi:hypothetical protein
MNMNWLMNHLDRNWFYYTLTGCVIYFLVFLMILYLDETIGSITIYSILFSLLVLFVVSFIFKVVATTIWVSLFYSFSIPFAILIALYVRKLPGLGKAQPYEKAIIFLILWVILFAIFFAISFFFKRLKN